MSEVNLTPMMKQYLDIKKKHKDSIIFFRLGDFYEMFFDDAKSAAKVLQLVLTNRNGIPMCGVPHHAVKSYLYKMLKAGYKVGIVDQLENPKEAKGIVKRDITRVITPGTLTEEDILDNKSNNFLCSIYLDAKSNFVGISFIDISTGDFFTTQLIIEQNFQSLINEIVKFNPTEIIVPESFAEKQKILLSILKTESNKYIYYIEDWKYDYSFAVENLKEQFKVLNLEGFGISDKLYSIQSAGAMLDYLKETQKSSIFNHIFSLQYYNPTNYMILDSATVRNLEIVQSLKDASSKGTLFSIIDKTLTNGGGRLLKKRLLQPLKDVEEIIKRLYAIKYFFDNTIIRNELRDILSDVRDIERIMSKLNCNRVNGRDLIALSKTLKLIPIMKKILIECDNSYINQIISDMDSCEDIFKLIEEAIEEDPPVAITEGNLIKESYDEVIAKYKKTKREGKDWLINLQKTEREKTGIPSLKVSYNKVFGYYIDVTKTHKAKVPDYYELKQTLVNSNRYITTELKEYENLILESDEKLVTLEYETFNVIKEKIALQTQRIQTTANSISLLDVYTSLAEIAKLNNYVLPEINNFNEINIKNSRHPVIEKMQTDNEFIPNDILLNDETDKMYIITGPNMAGKSTYIRQVALNVLLAQIGSFIPAEEAVIGVVDRIFTRVGASDNLVKGQSTFMVEMIETSNIINNATKNSLIILDEIGRGTSTFDGLSLAWSIAEYILNTIGAKTLFATHYHELADLASVHKGIQNYNIAVKEWNGSLIFLRKILKGSVDKSYGIEVAKLAGLPPKIIEKAKKVLKTLEKEEINLIESSKPAIEKGYQLSLFDLEDDTDWVNELKNLNINTLTPLDALNKLSYIKSKLT